MTGGIVYPIGGRIHRWLADTYGDWRVAQIYKELNQYDTFEDAYWCPYGRTLNSSVRTSSWPCVETLYPSVDTLRRSVLSGGHPSCD